VPILESLILAAAGATAAVLLSLAFADCALSRALDVAGGAP
jgi:hypothetical protein